SKRVLPSQNRTESPPFPETLVPPRPRSHPNSAIGYQTELHCPKLPSSKIPTPGCCATARTLPHTRCSNTANLRATATTARFLAFLPPREASFSPHRFKSVSGPRRLRIQCAACTSSVRRYTSPSLLIRNCGWLWPDSLCLGRKPT